MSILKTAAATKAVRFAAVAGVVAASLIALTTGPAQAATSATVTPSTGDAAGGTVLTAKGRGFQDATGADVLKAVQFSTSACTTDATAGTGATNFLVTSSSSAVVTTPALAANTWYACFFDGTTASQTLLGQATYTTAAAPAPTTLSGAVSNVLSAPTTGKITVAVTGTNFTKNCKATVDGVTARTTYVSATALSIVLPAHAAKTGLKVVVTGEYGSGSSTDTITYFPSLSLKKAYGSGAANEVVTITGTGFSSYTFGSAVTNQDVVFVTAGTAWVAATSVISTTAKECGTTIVVSDTTLSCAAPALSEGPYTVMIINRDGTTSTKYGSSATPVSRAATYTVSSF